MSIRTGLSGAVLSAVLLGTAPMAIAATDIPTVTQRDGWAVHHSDMTYSRLVDTLKEAVAESDLSVVTEAGPTQAAAKRGVDIPGNRVIGVFNNDYAVRILSVSTAAMIEAPLIMYVTEAQDGTATLSWKKPSRVYEPYMDDGGKALQEAASSLEDDLAAIGEAALKTK